MVRGGGCPSEQLRSARRAIVTWERDRSLPVMVPLSGRGRGRGKQPGDKLVGRDDAADRVADSPLWGGTGVGMSAASRLHVSTRDFGFQ